MNYVVIFAGGVGQRMGSSIPKQFLMVNNKPIIVHTIEKFNNHSEIDGIVVVCKEEYIGQCKQYIIDYALNKVISIIPGGNNGQQSIYNGVKYLSENISKDNSDIVLIHDGVRPVINDELISKSISTTQKNGNSIAVSRAIETVIKVDDNGQIVETVDRDRCRNAKAPQCFVLSELWKIHKKAIEDGVTNMVDSASLMSFYGYELYTTECSQENIKVTTPNDYYMLVGMLGEREDI